MKGLLAAIVGLILTAPLAAKEPVFIAIIIDDVGHNLASGERAIALPAPVTLAVLPHSRYGTILAERAGTAGKEVMVHMPMANLSDKPIGPGGLQSFLSHGEFSSLIRQAIARVPNAQGVNNHMGSYLTQQKLEMGWLMDEVKRRNFFFIDSRTTPRTVASRVARQKSVFASSRDVFLDNEQTFYDIDHQFQRLLKTAKRRGTAIAIGHPHTITLDYLEMVIPQLALEGIHLIPASNLIAIQKMSEYGIAHQSAE